MKSLVSQLLKYTAFKGRASRTECWRFFIVAVLVGLLVGWMDAAWIDVRVGDYGLLGFLFLLAMVVPCCALTVRRLHDFGLSGWWVWLSVVPFLGLVVHLAVFFYPGDPESNKYGCPSGHTGQD